MPKFTAEEARLIRRALRIASEDGSIYPTSEDGEADERIVAEINAKIAEIEHKLSAPWNRTP